MTTKNLPATPLPWHTTHPLDMDMSRNPSNESVRIDAESGQPAVAIMVEYGEKFNEGKRARDARYIAHAANEYPRLVQALRDIAKRADDECSRTHEGPHFEGLRAIYNRADYLLRALGEEQ